MNIYALQTRVTHTHEGDQKRFRGELLYVTEDNGAGVPISWTEGIDDPMDVLVRLVRLAIPLAVEADTRPAALILVFRDESNCPECRVKSSEEEQ